MDKNRLEEELEGTIFGTYADLRSQFIENFKGASQSETDDLAYFWVVRSTDTEYFCQFTDKGEEREASIIHDLADEGRLNGVWWIPRSEERYTVGTWSDSKSFEVSIYRRGFNSFTIYGSQKRKAYILKRGEEVLHLADEEVEQVEDAVEANEDFNYVLEDYV